MQTFKDTKTNKIYQFEDDVQVLNTSGVYTFSTVNNVELSNLPTTLEPYAIPAPTIAELLSKAKTEQIGKIYNAYNLAITANISFTTSASVTNVFQADLKSQGLLEKVLNGFTISGSVPTGFYWVAVDNSQVAFTFKDLQNLSLAMITRGWISFQNLQNKKNNIENALTISDVEAIVF